MKSKNVTIVKNKTVQKTNVVNVLITRFYILTESNVWKNVMKDSTWGRVKNNASTVHHTVKNAVPMKNAVNVIVDTI